MPVAGVGGTGEGGFGEGGLGEGGEGGFGEGGEGASSPTVEFGRTIGNMGNIEIHDLAAKPSGAFAIAASTYNQDVDFGAPTSPLIQLGGLDAVIAEFSSSGSPVRAALFGNSSDQIASAVAYDPSGALITAETHSSAPTPGIRLTRAHPSLTWSRFCQGWATAEAIAVDAEGSVFSTGFFTGSIDFGGGPLPASAGSTYVVKFDRRGDWLWGRELSGSYSVPSGIATDSAGNVLVVGTFSGTIDFGAGPITGVGSNDQYIVKLSSTGELLFAHTYAGNNYQRIHDVAVMSDDSFVIAGGFTGDLDLGTGSMHGSGAILVSRLTAGGQTSWARRIESTSGEAIAFDVAVTPSDDIVLAGSFQGTLEVPTPLQATGLDAFAIGLSPGGSFRWARPFGGPNRQEALFVDMDAKGDVLVGGRFSDSIDFGKGPVSASSSFMDLFIAKIAP